MKKLATLLLSTALVGGLALSAFTPASAAETNVRYMQRGNFAGQQMQQGPNAQGYGMMQGQQKGGPGMMQGQQMGGPGMGMGQGGILRLACSADGAPLLELALNNLTERLTLTADQKTLFDTFKTSALTSQTTYADACQVPTADATTLPNPVENLKRFQTNATARIAAIDSVLPSLEAFYSSLSDAQKAEVVLPMHNNMQFGPGNFGPGRGQGRGFSR